MFDFFNNKEKLICVKERKYTGSDQLIHKKWNCPSCDIDVKSMFNYCPNCGQHLYWGEVNFEDILYDREIER